MYRKWKRLQSWQTCSWIFTKKHRFTSSYASYCPTSTASHKVSAHSTLRIALWALDTCPFHSLSPGWLRMFRRQKRHSTNFPTYPTQKWTKITWKLSTYCLSYTESFSISGGRCCCRSAINPAMATGDRGFYQTFHGSWDSRCVL